MVCESEVCQEIISKLVSGGVSEAMAGTVMGVLIGVGIMVALIIMAMFYVYNALAWYTIGKKLKYKYSWLAWIPIAKWAMVLQMGGFHWAWVFLFLIPLLGWIPLFVLLIIATWKIYDKRKYPGWFSLAILIPELGGLLYIIIIGFVAWKDRNKMLFS